MSIKVNYLLFKMRKLKKKIVNKQIIELTIQYQYKSNHAIFDQHLFFINRQSVKKKGLKND